MSGLSASTYSCGGEGSRGGSGVASRGGAGGLRTAFLKLSLPFFKRLVGFADGFSSSLDVGGDESEDSPEDDMPMVEQASVKSRW